jgi:hypothetical protein
MIVRYTHPYADGKQDEDVSGREALDVKRGRAALLPGSIECDPRTRHRLSSACRVNQNPGKELFRGLERQIVTLRGGDRFGIGWAPLLKSRKLYAFRLFALHPLRAVVHSVPPAAGRKLIAGVRCKCEQRRDQRKAEQKEQRDGQYAAHSEIVTHAKYN